jgi:FKBP-type peptidyl-prolyl cis-trans isomerase
MKISRMNVLLMLGLVALAACGEKASHHKTPGGLAYQVYEGKGGDTIYKGSFLKLHVTQKINDSVYFSSADKMPVYIMVTEPQMYDVSEIWTRVRVGDSIVAVQMMDTFIKRNPASVPPHLRNGDKIYTYARILDVFATDSLKELDKKKTEAEYLASEIRFIEKYLADKKIQAQKTPSGVYVEVINPGTGEQVKSRNYVSVNYTGRTFDGVTFDSNTDSTFNHVEPLSFTVDNEEMIKAFDEAVKVLRKGAKARFYIPSMLAYADRPSSPLIKPYDKLIFEIEVTDVQASAPATEPPSAH